MATEDTMAYPRCPHYFRGCALVAPCCKEPVMCHVCHDEGEHGCQSHLDRRSVRQLVCLACGELQPGPISDNAACVYCQAPFGAQHACTVCHIYSHDTDMWHCERCGICRLGAREEYVHCDACDACVPRQVFARHACARNAMHRECLVCRRYLFTSRTPVAQLPCGHLAVHVGCLAQHQQQQQQQQRTGSGLAQQAPGQLITCPHCSELEAASRARAACRESAQRRGDHCTSVSGTEGLEGLLEGLRLGDQRADEVVCAARAQSAVYLEGAVTQGEYFRRFNELPLLANPTQEEDEAGRAAVDKVCRTLQHRLSCAKVDRVHVGGSFGRRTHVRGRFDVDLMVALNDFDPHDKARAGRVVDEAARVLSASNDGAAVERRPDLNMVQLEVAGVEMDVPFVHNVAGGAADKARAQRDALVEPLLELSDADVSKSLPDRARERAVGEALTAFVAAQHKTANEAVRLFKAWAKCGLAERGLLKSRKLPSIALELIVLAAWQEERSASGPEERLAVAAQAGCVGENGDYGSISPTRSLLLRVFMRALEAASRLDDPDAPAVMVDAGPGLGYTREQGMRFRPCWGLQWPHIVHPIDPTCNVARLPPGDTRPPWDWPGLAREAGRLMSVIRHCSLEALLQESSLGAALDRLRRGVGRRE